MLPAFKRFFLFALLALTGLAALVIGAAVSRAGHEPRALVWAIKGVLAHGFLLLVSFAAFTALDRPRARILAIGGLFLAGLMLLLVPFYIGWEIVDPLKLARVDDLAHLRMQRLVETGILTAGLFCLIPFVLAPRMQRVGRIAQYTTILYLTVAYHFTLLWLWRSDTQLVQEAVVTLLIPAGACMLGVFALHKFFEIRQADPLTAVTPSVYIQCPRCHHYQTLGLGESRCTDCRLRISLAVEEPRCPNCRFNLYGLTRPLCPECGLQLDPDDLPPIKKLPAAA